MLFSLQYVAVFMADRKTCSKPGDFCPELEK